LGGRMRRFLPIGAVLVVIVAGGRAMAGLRPTDLRCEYLVNPLGMDVREPRLSWVLRDEEGSRGARQIGYRVVAASSEKALAVDQGDLWDTGRVESDRSIHIEYGGKPLEEGMRCFWKVRVWDEQGRQSPWSDEAHWLVGPLEPEDWKAQWIGSAPAEDASQADEAEASAFSMQGCQWIWYDEGDPREEAAPGTVCFRRDFSLPMLAEVRSARFILSVDNSARVSVNGESVGKTHDWKQWSSLDVGASLQPGLNVIAVEARNESKGPAGFIGRLEVTLEEGDPVSVETDVEWKAERQGGPSWEDPDLDVSSWPRAKELGELGVSPWGHPKEPVREPTQREPSPLFRTSFDVNKNVQSAWVYLCGLGYHELRLNGEKMGDHTLDPAFTRYDRRVLYVTHDVTDRLRNGENVLGVLLGNGWYNMHTRAEWNFDQAPWRGDPCLLLQLTMRFEDGSVERIVSDETWRTVPGPVQFDSIRNGEVYDAREERQGWDRPGYDDSSWENAERAVPPSGVLTSQKMPAVRVTQTRKPVSVTEPKPGVFVFDMGQNFSGRAMIKVSGSAGTEITLKYAERLREDGTIHQQNKVYTYSGPFQTDRYVLKGEGEEIWEARFTYHGFQYLQVEGFPGRPTLDNVRGRVLHTDFETAGTFDCSDALLNNIQLNTLWSYRSNFVGYPTDCPHREKNGWTGDAHLAAELGLLNFESASAYTKWLDDFRDEQRPNGELPGIIPTSGWGYGVGPAWDTAYLHIPWYLYLYRGDERILAEHYYRLVKYVEYLKSRAENHIVSYGLGDWCPAETKTPSPLTSTAYYYADLVLLSRMAGVLGKTEDANLYRTKARAVRSAFNHSFYDQETARYGGGTQTAQACALYHGLVPKGDENAVLAKLLKAIRDKDDHLDCGILGTKYVLDVLTAYGRQDVAYKIVTGTDFPSWGHWIEQGATTLWENWNGAASRNHIMFGHVSAWFYQALGGIQVDPESPGFKHFVLKPYVPKRLAWVDASYLSPYGSIRSHWKQEGSKLRWEVSVPPNTTTTLYVPTIDAKQVVEGDRPAAEAEGLRERDAVSGFAVYEAGSGKYHFTSPL